jgi:hypothetical protein
LRNSTSISVKEAVAFRLLKTPRKYIEQASSDGLEHHQGEYLLKRRQAVQKEIDGQESGVTIVNKRTGSACNGRISEI